MDIGVDSAANRFRAKRFQDFRLLVEAALKEKPVVKILDIGGTVKYWTLHGADLLDGRIEVTVVNMSLGDTGRAVAHVNAAEGDARSLDYPDNTFDIVHSNSVIEHVGRWEDMEAMAREVRRLAPAYFVQTPYYWFPVEPHARTLFIHWLPEPVRYRMLLKRKLGFWKRATDPAAAVRRVQSAVLIDRLQFATLFPDADVQFERFYGFAKSLIGVRRARSNA